MTNEKTTHYIHRNDRNMYISSSDQHYFNIASVRTFESSAVWDEYNHHNFPDKTAFHMQFDDERVCDMRRIRAYKEQKTGVILMETCLWDYEDGKYDPQKKSAFREIAEEDVLIQNQKEKYHFTTKESFTIRGFDDGGLIAHNLIFVPKNTKFAWVKEGIKINDPGSLIRPEWHMTSLRNTEIGIEINMPTKYIEMIMNPISKKHSMPKDTEAYPYQTNCRCCRKMINAPGLGANDYDILQDFDKGSHRYIAYDRTTDEYGNDMTLYREVSIYLWLCDECYQRLYRAHPHTWAFQTEKQPFLLPGWYPFDKKLHEYF